MNAGWPFAVVCVMLVAAPRAEAQQQPPPPAPPSQMPAALSVPNPLAGMRPGPHDLYQSPDGSDRFQHLSEHPAPSPPFVFPGVYFPGPYYVPYYPGSTYPPLAHVTVVRPPVARGRLTLETVPDSAQVYVDGFYMGLAGEFGLRGRALDLTVGSHHVELRSPEHDTLSFSVMVQPDETIRYRGDMRRLSSPAVAPAPAAAGPLPARRAQVVTYVIPKCYAGNKPPAQPLPAGCDRRKMQTHK
jgi:PEGA domain